MGTPNGPCVWPEAQQVDDGVSLLLPSILSTEAAPPEATAVVEPHWLELNIHVLTRVQPTPVPPPASAARTATLRLVFGHGILSGLPAASPAHV